LRTGYIGELFGPKGEELTGGWRKLYNVELCNMYYSQNNIRMIKSRRLRLAGHVVHIGEMRDAYKTFFWKA
jgi:hypothetical protein